MKFLLSGYYGFGNAGDEAVLAAIVQTIAALQPAARFTVTSGNPSHTVSRFNSETTRVAAVPRQSFGALGRAIRSCDVFISGGGSLLQDVTSLRNIVYYTGLIRMATLARKPVMIYAQGIGPLARPLSQKLARAAATAARIVTVRDEASKTLLEQIGVTREVVVTADPVWALTPQPLSGSAAPEAPPPAEVARTWALSLRPWHGYEYDPVLSAQLRDGLQAAAHSASARYRAVPMQDATDRAVMAHIADPARDLIHDTSRLHPREIMALCGRADAMIAMRLHALIFAAAQSVPCVAVNYDPKVEALAHIIGAPLLPDLGRQPLAGLAAAVATARAMDSEKLADLQSLARSNAELAVGLG